MRTNFFGAESGEEVGDTVEVDDVDVDVDVDVDDAVEEWDGLGVAELELELEVDFEVELDVMVALVDEGGCTSPVNASALILLGHSKLSCPVIWGMNSPVTSM